MLLVSAEEMRALDRLTIESGHATGEELMEHAGRGVVDALERRYGPVLALRVLVLCGPGNNGGDGLVAARHLRRRGADVHVGLLGDPERLRPDARAHLRRLESEEVHAAAIASPERLAELVARRDPWDLALDALLGTGARGAPEGLIDEAVRALGSLRHPARVVAVDMPTGVEADRGEAPGRAVVADLTVTFGLPKRGQLFYPGRAHVGDLEVIDIGLLPGASIAAIAVELAGEAEMAALLPPRDPRAHKGAVGRVLVVGGSPGLTGAVTLAARAATRAGAGYVQVAVPASLNDVLEVKLTEEMTIPCPETEGRTLAAAAQRRIEEVARRVDAIALGPGMTRAGETADLARRLAVDDPRAVVIDADGLNALEGRAETLKRAAGPRVLTPHLIEMSRLTGRDPERLDAARIEEARAWAREWNATVLLKGVPTVVASPQGSVTVNPTGNPGMATAGMGDVLTGIITTLLAQGLAPYDAARLGAFVHGRAGDRIALRRGIRGLRAGDVVEELPETLQALAEIAERPPRDAATDPGGSRLLDASVAGRTGRGAPEARGTRGGP